MGLFVFSGVGALAMAKEEALPNFLILLADDARADQFGFAGNRVAHTPVIDQLAREGVVFRQAFVTTSICVVSRASIFTGQHLRRHGISEFKQRFTDEVWRETYPARLRHAGYFTGMVGNFGVGRLHTPENAFDFWCGDTGILSYAEAGTDRHLTVRQADDAIAFLEAAPTNRPFCLSVSFKAPHAQDRASNEYPADPREGKLFEDRSMPEPNDEQIALFDSLPDAVRESEGRVRWERRFRDPTVRQENLRNYYRLVAGMDREIGRILNALAEAGRSHNTIVVFASDNGYLWGERGLVWKWFPFDESIRIPLIIYDPRRPSGPDTVEAIALNIDLAATLLDYAELPESPAVQGRSLRGWVDGEEERNWREAFFYDHQTLPHLIPPSEGVRGERWAYVRWTRTDPVMEELYDMASDPMQLHNRVHSSAYAETLETMRTLWAELREEAAGK